MYTNFEASVRLYQFTKIPFGATNGITAFQILKSKIIKETLKCTLHLT